MFQAIGTAGLIKPLPFSRWLVSAAVGTLLISTLILVVSTLEEMAPGAFTVTKEEGPQVFVLHMKQPPPPLPRAAFAATTPVAKPARSLNKTIIPKTAQDKPISEPVSSPSEDEKASQNKILDAISSSDNPNSDVGDAPTGNEGISALPFNQLSGDPGIQVASAPPEIRTIEFSPGEFLNARDVQQRAQAKFPETLKRANIERADAIVEVICGESGEVLDVVWVSGNILVRDAVMEAARSARFSPRPYIFRVRLPFRFRLN